MNRRQGLAPVLRVVLIAVGAMVASQTPALALDKIRFAYLRTQSLTSMLYADQKGYFRNEGLELDFISVPGGPAVVSAIASGSADIGYSAPTPVAFARQEGQPVRFFVGLQWEQRPDSMWGVVVASERSNVKSLKELKGKTVSVGPAGGLCELTIREALASAGIGWDDIKALYIPFPQQQAALELGTADVACTFDPFYAAIRNSKVRPVLLSEGFLVNSKDRYNTDGLFANETWLRANPRVIEALKRALHLAIADMKKNPEIANRILLEDFKIPQALASQLREVAPSVDIKPSDLAPVVEAMKRAGMLKSGLTADDLVYTGN